MTEQTQAFKNGRIFNFDVDLGSGHTAYRRASLIDLYLQAKFYWHQRNFLWTDRRTHSFIRSTASKSQPKRFLSKLQSVSNLVTITHSYRCHKRLECLCDNSRQYLCKPGWADQSRQAASLRCKHHMWRQCRHCIEKDKPHDTLHNNHTGLHRISTAVTRARYDKSTPLQSQQCHLIHCHHRFVFQMDLR